MSRTPLPSSPESPPASNAEEAIGGGDGDGDSPPSTHQLIADLGREQRELAREQRATRRLLEEVVATRRDDIKDISRRLDAIMDLLKEALSR